MMVRIVNRLYINQVGRNNRPELLLIFFLILLCTITASAQDITNISSAKPLIVYGSVHAGTSYMTGPASPGMDPFGYSAGANITLDFYEVFQLPFSFTISKYGTGYNMMDFRRFGISPRYKKFQVHLGYRSYQLSPYILSGMTTLGAGAEYNGDKFRVLLFYGKVMDQFYTGSTYIVFDDPEVEHYTRWNYGAKIGFGKVANSVNLHIYHAEDKANTGSSDFLLKNNLNPMENLALGIDVNQQFFKVLTFTANGASSIVTFNTEGRGIDGSDEQEKWIATAAPILAVNKTTRISFAYDAKLALRIKGYSLGIKYQHVDPLFNSLGVSFMQKNVNNYLIDFGGGFFKRKVNLRGSVGLQYLNKGGFTGKEQRRIIYKLNSNINFSRQFSVQAFYNNMSQDAIPSLKEVGDSLVFTTNTEGMNASFRYSPGRGNERPHSIRGSFARNTFDIVNLGLTLSSSSNTNSNLSYNYNQKKGWRAGAGINYSLLSSGDDRTTRRYGLNANLGRNITEDFTANLNTSFRLNNVNNQSDGNVITAGLQISWRGSRKHNLSVNLNQLIRNTSILKAKNEFRARLNYSYSFSSNNKN